MKMRKFILITLLCALVVFGCDDDNNTETHVHDYGTEWKSNATQHWRECSCGDKTDVADHDWEWLETTQPTITTEGEETGTCTTCGATETKTVAKLKEYTTSNIFSVTTVTFIGNFTDEEWPDIYDQVITAFNTAHDSCTGPQKNTIRLAFNNATVTIENTTEYQTCKVVKGVPKAMSININGLEELTAVMLYNAAIAMRDDKDYVDGE